MTSVLISLGFWQLDRAEQKRTYLAQQQVLLSGGQVVIDASTTDDLALLKYRPVTVNGHYDEQHQFLIDNQHVNGKVGYYILTPFWVAGSDKAVLVNRGWLPLNKDRSVLPALPLSTVETDLTGRVNSFPSVGIKLRG